MSESVAVLSGRIDYRTGDVITGHERFDIAHHAGGHILRALCVLDDADLIRDVTIAMDRQWRPLDGYCRITRGGVTEATLWFDVDGEGVDVAAHIGDRRLPVQRIATDGPLPYLGLHPLQGDGLISLVRGTAQPGIFLPIQTVTNSISPNGDEAIAAQSMTIDVAYVGEEAVEVPAGHFAGLRYQLRWREDWPPADLWVRSDGLFLRMVWALVPTVYELARLGDSRT
ncbi:MAG TPA: hypothetical protein VF475_09285 [Sphingobium sp.]